MTLCLFNIDLVKLNKQKKNPHKKKLLFQFDENQREKVAKIKINILKLKRKYTYLIIN